MHAKMFQGADFVEFDVLLTKDHVPVIYHDFSICLSTARKASSLMYIAVPQKNLPPFYSHPLGYCVSILLAACLFFLLLFALKRSLNSERYIS